MKIKLINILLFFVLTFGAASSVFVVSAAEIPERLFDINLAINDAIIRSIDELNAKVAFVSFGKVPTPVEAIFTILDSTGKEVYSGKENIVVETEFVLDKKFKGAVLAPGKYTLVLKTIYNTSVEDKFKQNFEIIKEGESIAFWKTWKFLGLVTILYMAAAIWGFSRI